MMWRRIVAVCSIALIAGGCATEPMRNLQRGFQNLFQTGKGKPALEAGLRQYEEGAYVEASRNLQTALEHGLDSASQVDAHKHLAFIHCASNRTGPCRDEFRKALKINPALELSAAEAGHPAWGPVFRSVKTGR